MKILLINPFIEQMHRELGYAENFRPPLGLTYLAAVLEKAGHDVELLDALMLGIQFPKLKRILEETKPELVGVSSFTPTRYECFRTADRIKETLGPEVKVVLGGPHASAVPEDTLEKVRSVDYVVRGEGEISLLELVEAIEQKKDPSEVPGISGRKNGSLFHAPDRPVVKKIDDLPMPARHLIPMKRYGTRMPSTMSRCTTILTSRGCPGRCIFCTRDWFSRSSRYHSPERILQEVEEVIGRYGIRNIIFQDDTFTSNRKRIFALCEEIHRRNLKFKWLATTRVDTLSPELLREMKAAGCEILTVGAESMIPETLKWLKKGFTPEQVRQGIKWARAEGLIVRCTYLIGIGNETEEDVIRSVSEARELEVDKLKANVGLSIYPGTPVHPMAIEAGALPADYSYAEGYEDPEKRYGNQETPRWYTDRVPLKRLLELRKETELNILFTKFGLRMVAHRIRKVARNFTHHPLETTTKIRKFALSMIKGARLRRASKV